MSRTPSEPGSPSEREAPQDANLPRIPGITLDREIARGGMGVVYSGRQDFLDRRVAVKLLSLDLAGEKFAQRFRREAKILAGIKHPNIVACHLAGTTEDGQSYLVMEFVDGPTLKAHIAKEGPLPCSSALRLAKAVAQALHHALQMGVIHRDVKPENILLESITSTAVDIAFPYVPKLVDLGLARTTSSEAAGLGLTSPGSVMGTPATMSPEQFDDPDSVDFLTDIYGLGCALYEMLVGAAPFRSGKLTEIVARKRQPFGPNPCVEAAPVPAAVGALVSSMLAANRQDRPRSYKDLEDQLDALLAALPAAAHPLQETVAELGATVPASAAPKTGPGLLRTAEIDFLQQGLGNGGGSAAPAFREGSAAATAPPAAGRRRSWLAIGGAAAALVAIVVFVATRGGGGGGNDGSSVAGNRAPRLGGILGPDTIPLRQWATLTAQAEDADGDALTYRWSGAEEVVFSAAQAQTTKVRIVDGLPGETFEVRVAVDDGRNAAVGATLQLRLAEAGFPSRPFLVGMKSDPRWTFTPPDPGLRWTPITDQPVVSCRAGLQQLTATTAMGDESFWRLTGRLGARPADEDPSRYATTGVRIECGDDGWSLVCRRAGDLGEQWSIELQPERRVRGVWQAQASGGRRRVEWRESDEALDHPYAEFTITRRRDELMLRWGQGQSFEQFVAPIQGGAEPNLTLWVDRGAGEFRDFTLW
ncbi:MAG: serine/threonine protein kinase [Planctomycetes bacterium]|nr:serine/threonine protein kinase [Planctomycetota bacterium]